MRYQPWAGFLVLAVDAVVAVRLARVIVSRPGERPRATGVMAVWLALIGVAAGLVLTRPVFGERYALPLALHGCATVLTFRLYPLVTGRGLAVAGVVTALALVVGNWGPGIAFGELRKYMYREIRTDIESGMPVRFLAEQHAGHLLPVLPNRAEHLTRWMDELHEDRVGWFAKAQATPNTIPIAGPVFGPLVVAPGVPSGALPGPERQVIGAQVEVRTDQHVFGLLSIEWGDPDKGERAAVYLLGASGEVQNVQFWINAAPAEVRFRTLGAPAPITVTRLEWLVTSPAR
jgi:hypothetical protein